MEKKDTVTSRSDSKEQHIQKLKMQARRHKEMCRKWFRILQGQNRFLLREDFISLNSIDEGAFERAFIELFGKEFSTFKRIFSQSMDKLEEELTKEKLHENDSKTALTALMTPFQSFFHFGWPMYTTFKTRDDFRKYTGKDIQLFKDSKIRDIDAMEMHLIRAILLEHVIEKRLKLHKALDARLVVTESSGTKSDKQDTSSISGNDTTNAVDADIKPVNDKELMAEDIVQRQDKSPLLGLSSDNKTTEFSI
ncbi:hypothetical protein Tco_0185320 [Tanacetum coccineum]